MELKKNTQEVIGLVPASGTASRLAPLPFSKELYPVGLRIEEESGAQRPKAVCHYVLERMRLAAITKTYIVIRKGKWDLPGYLKDGKLIDMHLAYLIMDLPYGVPYTLDQAYPFLQNAVVAFGFPDIIFQPEDAFVRLFHRQAETDADLVLGLFEAVDPRKVDMVDQDSDGRIRGIQVKPALTQLRYTWLMAVWTPIFTRFMHEYVIIDQKRMSNSKADVKYEDDAELFIGDVIQSAVEQDMRIDSVVFKKGKYLDIGTPEAIAKAIKVKF